jgi:hypothetical protein
MIKKNFKKLLSTLPMSVSLSTSPSFFFLLCSFVFDRCFFFPSSQTEMLPHAEKWDAEHFFPKGQLSLSLTFSLLRSF